jgi:hypothetical protein
MRRIIEQRRERFVSFDGLPALTEGRRAIWSVINDAFAASTFEKVERIGLPAISRG